MFCFFTKVSGGGGIREGNKEGLKQEGTRAGPRGSSRLVIPPNCQLTPSPVAAALATEDHGVTPCFVENRKTEKVTTK